MGDPRRGRSAAGPEKERGGSGPQVLHAANIDARVIGGAKRKGFSHREEKPFVR